MENGYEVLFLVALAGWTVAQIVLRRRKLRKMGQQELELLATYFSDGEDWVEVDPADFAWLDLAFYERATEAFVEAGFENLGDFESLAATRAFPRTRKFERWFVSEDRTVIGEVCHLMDRPNAKSLKRKQAVRVDHRTFELITAFEDGTYVRSRNAAEIRQIAMPPEIVDFDHPADTPLASLIDRHDVAVKQTISVRSVVPIQFESRADVLAGSERIHFLTGAFRRKLGFQSREEILSVVGKKPPRLLEAYIRVFEDARRKYEQEEEVGDAAASQP